MSLHGDNRDKNVPSFMLEWGKVELENLKKYKMMQGSGKHGDWTDKDFNMLAVRLIKYMGEFMVSIDEVNYRGTIEAIADMINTGELLFPKAQQRYEEQREELSGRDPYVEPKNIEDTQGDQTSTRLE